MSLDRLTPGGVFIPTPHLDASPRSPKEKRLTVTEHNTVNALRLAFKLSQESSEGVVPSQARKNVYLTIEQHALNLQETNGLLLNPLHEALLYPAKDLREELREGTSREADFAGQRLSHWAELNQAFSKFEDLLSTPALIMGALTSGRSLAERQEKLSPFYFDLAFGDPGFNRGEYGRASFEQMLTADFLAQKASHFTVSDSNAAWFKKRSAQVWRIWLERQDNPSAEALAAVNVALSR